MDYPKPRYRDPIMVDPENYEWLPLADMPGVREKPLGTFTERQCAATLIKLARGATYRAGGRSVYLVLSGSGIVGDGAVSAVDRALTLTPAKPTDLVARDASEVSAPGFARSCRARQPAPARVGSRGISMPLPSFHASGRARAAVEHRARGGLWRPASARLAALVQDHSDRCTRRRSGIRACGWKSSAPRSPSRCCAPAPRLLRNFVARRLIWPGQLR